MIYGTTFYLEMLPKDFPSEIIPGIGAFQAASAAVKMSPVFGYDTSSAIITMDDWPGRSDLNKKLMAAQSSMIFYTMNLNYTALFAQLTKYYPPPPRLPLCRMRETGKAKSVTQHCRPLSDRCRLQKPSG